MEDIVDEKYEWEAFGYGEVFGQEEELDEGSVDWLIAEELLAIDRGDPPPPPPEPMIVVKNGELT